jgi:signal transduction histidine kinase
MRVLLRIVLALAFGLAALPAAAADAKFPKAVEAEFANAKAAMMQDPATVLRHVAAAEALAVKIPDVRQRAFALATARWLAGEAHLRNDQPDAAAPLLAEGLRLIAPFKEALKLRGDLVMSQGELYVQRDQAALALVSYQQAFQIFVAARQPRSQAIAYQNIALLYSSANDNENAEKYFRQAAEQFDGDPMLSLSLHNNRGNVLLTLERYPEAEAEYLKALATARDEQNALLEARILINVARTRLEARKYNSAEQALTQGFALTRGPEAQGVRQQLQATAARAAMERGDLKRAHVLITRAFAGVDLTKTSSSQRYAHTVAYMIFSRAGDPALALRHLEAVRRLTDEAAKVATTTGAALAAAQFDFAGQQTRIANLRAEQIRKSAEFQRNLFLSIGGATLVIIVLLIVALFLIRRSRNQVRDANVVLGETNTALEKALKAKTEFLATTSHEIRTPLNGILGMTQVMLSNPSLSSDVRDRIGIVQGAGLTMRALVDDILDVAKMETGNLTVDAAPMDLCAVLREVTRMWEEQARAKGLAFGLELSHAPHWIVSDAGRLRQIVFNLLSNAIKFTEAGAVTVRAIDEGEDGARRLKLVISDTGIGIPADKREEIFESFKQVDAGTTRKFGGTGLGLTICRNLAQALGGDISVEGAEGQGSRFTVDLPLVPAEAPADAVAKVSGQGTMLVLDRNPIARSMLKTLLEPRVGTLRFLATPDEALAALGEGEVTHLVMDEGTIKAAGDDPFATLGRLAAAAREAGAVGAVLWARPDAETIARFAELNLDQVIEKPISASALIAALVSDAKENSDKPGPGPLVSRAA